MDKLNAEQLKAARLLLTLTPAAAARLFKTALRTWQAYESGTRGVPARISDEVQAAVAERNALAAKLAQSAELDRLQKEYVGFDFGSNATLGHYLRRSAVSQTFTKKS